MAAGRRARKASGGSEAAGLRQARRPRTHVRIRRPPPSKPGRRRLLARKTTASSEEKVTQRAFDNAEARCGGVKKDRLEDEQSVTNRGIFRSEQSPGLDQDGVRKRERER